MKNTLWIAKGKHHGEEVYLTHRVRETREELEADMMLKARLEGFNGTIAEWLEHLEWQIVEIEFKEAT